jgi:polysaccharide biosynthesis/export protein
VLVRPDGAFSFPLVGEIDARGKSVSELNKIVSDRLGKYIADAVVTVSLTEVKGNKIFVIGQVNKPGEFIVNPSVNVMQALSMAGGVTAFAATNDIKILRRNGATQQAMAFQYGDVVRGRSLDQNVELLSGDVVVVP